MNRQINIEEVKKLFDYSYDYDTCNSIFKERISNNPLYGSNKLLGVCISESNNILTFVSEDERKEIHILNLLLDEFKNDYRNKRINKIVS